jgi:hypothetical protein
MTAKTRSALKKQLWKVAFAKTALYQGRLACEFIITNSKQIDQGTYHVLMTGFTMLYARLFDSGNHGVGSLPDKFQTFRDARLQNLHSALMVARNLFVAHMNAGYKYCDESGREKDELLKLAVVMGAPSADGKSDVRTQVIGPEVPRENIPLYKALCEDLLQRLGVEESNLLTRLYDGAGHLKVGVNMVSIFDES